MIDTIKFHVPVDDIHSLQELKTTFTQIKKQDLKTGTIDYEFYTSSIELGSHHRTIAIRILDTTPLGFFLELSLPKYNKGNNVEMIYPSNLNKILEALYRELCSNINYQLPDYSLWSIYRLDVCYNWIFKNLEEATSAMSFIQRIDYPRKQKYVYQTSVMYKGTAYTIKFYLKGAEFKRHDFKIIKENNPDHAHELLHWANRILRFEIGFKRRYLNELLNTSVTHIDDISDDLKIEQILSSYLKEKVFRYVTLTNTTESQLEEILYNNFTKVKATRLYQFYKDFYVENGAIKSRMLAGGLDRSTIYRYKRDLKNVGIGFDLPDENGRSILEQLVIPSANSKFDLICTDKEYGRAI